MSSRCTLRWALPGLTLTGSLRQSIGLGAQAVHNVIQAMSCKGVVMRNWREHIVSDPEILLGKPTVKGTRISVELILGWLAEGWTFEQLLEAYPHISRDDVLAALAFAAEMMREEQYVAVHKAA